MSDGVLFSNYFLTDGVALTEDWAALDDPTLANARAILAPLIADFESRVAPSEGNTERDLIDKILPLLGWADFTVQEKANDKGRLDVPDYLLYLDGDAKQTATRAKSATQRYAQGIAILEAKAWNLPLDKGDAGSAGAPSTQLLRYLGTVDVATSGKIRFGILTNGHLWRLYDHKARSRLEGFFEINLSQALTDDHILRQFLTFFARSAFIPGITGKTALIDAIEESRSFEARVTDALAKTVFSEVFPALINALAAHDPQQPKTLDSAYFGELREAALTWLYRLLFVLYAEDRDLIPTRQRRDGLRQMRDEVAHALDHKEGLSEHPENDRDLRSLWHKIDVGDRGIGLPPYNGGLFKAGRSALLDRSLIPDAEFAPLLDALSRERTGDAPRFINYRDLNVQHLGSVYERLLEHDPRMEDGQIVIQPQVFARKTSGSYYTPEELVMLVIRRTIGPLLDEKRRLFTDAVAEQAPRKQDAYYRLAKVAEYDPASAFLTLKICDPAMGSGHFLVSLVDYLADQVMLATTDASSEVSFADYRSPLLDRLEAIRERIKQQAAEHGWKVEENQLIDRQLVRRIILKRVIHGVDKNPMAVELAKLSLWLHTFTVGAPLSFLDHHLRCGDSLFGEWVGTGMQRLERGGLLKLDELSAAERGIAGMAMVEDLTDADIGEVRESARNFDDARERIEPLYRYLSLLQGYRWIEGTAEDALKKGKQLERESVRVQGDESLRLQRAAWNMKRKGRALDVLLDGDLGDPAAALDMCYGRIGDPKPKREGDDPALEPLIRAAEVASISNFLHWELAFPTVWNNWRSPSKRSGGFDAVIGNPPWDKMRFEEVQWFEPRVPAIARAETSAERHKLIETLKAKGDPLWENYLRARTLSEQAMAMARNTPTLAPLAGGDTNIYALFVAQAQKLLTNTGVCGFLVPTEIATSLSTAANFRLLTEKKRLHCILDFQNRLTGEKHQFFPDVYYREKFCVYVFGGEDRTWDSIDCAYFLKGTSDEQIDTQTSKMTPTEFGTFNPNTGTAPVFRTPDDAVLTRHIYGHYPILVDQRRVNQAKLWPISYVRAFDMANSSKLFRSSTQLQKDGHYPVADGRWRKGDIEWLPLYEGKVVQAYNHRAASIRREEANLHRVGQPVPATLDQLADPAWTPTTQFFVSNSEALNDWAVAIKDITSVTNARTVIAAIIPTRAAGHTLPILDLPVADRPAFVSMLNSFAYDYLARQKVQKNHLAWFILEQLPVIPPAAYDRQFGTMTAREIVAREVLHLTYTAHDMAPFARDMGWLEKPLPFRGGVGVGTVDHTQRPEDSPHPSAASRLLPSPEEEGLKIKPPILWNEADRRQRRARLDALYFHLYGLGKDDAAYILSTFPIVARHDEAEHGRFLTRDLILAQMDALTAGDPDAMISLR